MGDADENTGLLNPPTRLTLGAGSPSLFSIENYGHQLKLSDGRTYLLVGNSSPGSLYIFSDELETPNIGAITLNPISLTEYGANQDQYASSVIVQEGALYVGRFGGVFRYHPDDGESFIPLQRPSEPTNGSCISSVIELSLTAETLPRPIVLRRGCAESGSVAEHLELLVYADFTMETVDSALTLELTTAQTGEATFELFNLPRLLPLADGSHILSLPKLGTARHIMLDIQSGTFSAGPSANADSVQTEGNRSFGQAFGSGARIELATPWAGEAFFLTGVTSDQSRESYRIDLATGSETLLSELSGVEVFTAQPGPKNTFWVSGSKLATNTNFVLRFDPDGALVGQSSESGIQVLQIAPLISE